MSALDSSLDEIIKKSSGSSSDRPARRGGSRPTSSAPLGRAPGGRRTTRRAPAPYARAGGSAEPLSSTTLKVSESTVPNKLAGAVCNVVREGAALPRLLATGPGAINQAIKGIAIARKYLLDDDTPSDIIVQPHFEKDMRSGSSVELEIKKSKPIGREPTEDDLSAKEKTDCFKLAGAIAGRVRDGEEVALTTKGAVPVLVAVKAIALAQEYTRDENIDIKFAVQFRDLEDPELNNTPSTYLHFAILPRQR